MPTIKIPKVPKDAYDPSRRMSSLLRSQVQILQEAVLKAIDSDKETAHTIEVLTDLLQELAPKKVHVEQIQKSVYNAIDTEAEAAQCIRTYTRLLSELRPKTAPRAYSKSRRQKASKSKARRRGDARVALRKKTTRKSVSKSRRTAGAKKR